MVISGLGVEEAFCAAEEREDIVYVCVVCVCVVCMSRCDELRALAEGC